jgi:D-arabinose 5-phosphate isomerase GutQ
VADLLHLFVLVHVNQIDGELHEEAVHRLAGHNPQAFALAQAFVLQKTGAALLAGVGQVGVAGQSSVTRLVANNDFQAFFIARNGLTPTKSR